MTGEFLLKISTDMMTATGCIEPGDKEITADVIKSRLAEAGVNIGIREDNIQKLIDFNDYRIWLTLAEGKPAGETQAGYFDYFFNTNIQEGKTTINEDGSVYYGRRKVEVQAGEKLCEYHHPISGAFGYTVFSTVIAPKPVVELKLDAGEGVERIDNTYFAKVAGEVILSKTELVVKNLLTIEGDAKYGVDTQTEFVGAIHIKGDVLTGVSIKAKGRIEVDGTVEAANLYSEEDIIIRGGIKGDMQACVQAKGTIICPFIENGVVYADDTIQTDYVMRSNLRAGNAIHVHGQHGVIVGGKAQAQNEFIADEIGNEAGADTIIEIKHPDLRMLERSFIMANRQIHENVFFKIGEMGKSNKLVSGVEYHMVNGEFVTCEPGKYQPQRAVADNGTQEKKTVMVIDDEPIILKTFYGFIHERYNVMLAASAKDALAMLEQREPDLILLDVKMPVMDGPEFLTTIRQMAFKDYAQIPVIFVTAANDKDTIKKCITLFPQGYLVKPLSRDELLGAVDKVFA